MERRTTTLIFTGVAHAARAIVGLAFIVAGTTKALHPGVFIADIWSYQLVPQSWAYWTAAFLPFLEIAIGAALITGRQRDGARLLTATLLIVFLIALTISWARGLDIACGCFGTGAGEPANYPWLIFRDVLLIACLWADLAATREAAKDHPRKTAKTTHQHAETPDDRASARAGGRSEK
jgi:putative oxidoreductase